MFVVPNNSRLICCFCVITSICPTKIVNKKIVIFNFFLSTFAIIVNYHKTLHFDSRISIRLTPTCSLLLLLTNHNYFCSFSILQLLLKIHEKLYVFKIIYEIFFVSWSFQLEFFVVILRLCCVLIRLFRLGWSVPLFSTIFVTFWSLKVGFVGIKWEKLFEVREKKIKMADLEISEFNLLHILKMQLFCKIWLI